MPHIHEKLDFTADVFIVHKNKVLLRRHDKYKIWLPPGGHIELGEDPNEAAIREVKEEVGIDVVLAGTTPVFEDREGYLELLPPRFSNRHKINDTHEHVSMVYFATCDTSDVVQGETEVSDDIRWLTREELDNGGYEIIDSIKYYAKKALEELGK